MKISSYLPEKIIDSGDLQQLGWPSEKIFEKTGIRKRHICGENEFALDLAVSACRKLFKEHDINKESIDFILYCTQSPDFIVPNNAGILQKKLGLKNNIGSIDISQGCTGYVYGLSLAKGLLATGQSGNLLLVTADAWSKYIHKEDRATATIFGDGASASLLTKEDGLKIGEFIFGTDGDGAKHLCLKKKWLGNFDEKTLAESDEPDSFKNHGYLYMNGPEVFAFTLENVPLAINSLLKKSSLELSEIDHFVFHQANAYMLEHLRKKLEIPEQKFHVYLQDVGNTISSSIPITFEQLQKNSILLPGQKVMLVGFGVGYSWIATILNL